MMPPNDEGFTHALALTLTRKGLALLSHQKATMKGDLGVAEVNLGGTVPWRILWSAHLCLHHLDGLDIHAHQAPRQLLQESLLLRATVPD